MNTLVVLCLAVFAACVSAAPGGIATSYANSYLDNGHGYGGLGGFGGYGGLGGGYGGGYGFGGSNGLGGAGFVGAGYGGYGHGATSYANRQQEFHSSPAYGGGYGGYYGSYDHGY